MDFPQYRRYTTGSSYFKIVDERNFIEVQFVGDKVVLYKVTAHQYPEILRIQDMLNYQLDGVVEMDEDEIVNFEARVLKH
jgi:hypothetical protein